MKIVNATTTTEIPDVTNLQPQSAPDVAAILQATRLVSSWPLPTISPPPCVTNHNQRTSVDFTNDGSVETRSSVNFQVQGEDKDKIDMSNGDRPWMCRSPGMASTNMYSSTIAEHAEYLWGNRPSDVE